MVVHKKKTKVGAERDYSGITASHQSLLASDVFIEVTWKHVVDLDRNTLIIVPGRLEQDGRGRGTHNRAPLGLIQWKQPPEGGLGTGAQPLAVEVPSPAQQSAGH